MRRLGLVTIGSLILAGTSFYEALAAEISAPRELGDQITDPVQEIARLQTTGGRVSRRGDELVAWLDEEKSIAVTLRNWASAKGDPDNARYQFLAQAPHYFVFSLSYDHDAPTLFIVHRPSGQIKEFYREDLAVYVFPSRSRIAAIRRHDLRPEKPLVEILNMEASSPTVELTCQGQQGLGLVALSDNSIALRRKATATDIGKASLVMRNSQWEIAENEIGLTCRSEK